MVPVPLRKAAASGCSDGALPRGARTGAQHMLRLPRPTTARFGSFCTPLLITVACREEDATDPKSRHKGKLDTEDLLVARGVNFTSVRPVYIYGPLNYNPVEEFFFHRLKAGRPICVPNSGMQVTQLGHVKDLATAFTLCLGNPAASKEIFNISGTAHAWMLAPKVHPQLHSGKGRGGWPPGRSHWRPMAGMPLEQRGKWCPICGSSLRSSRGGRAGRAKRPPRLGRWQACGKHVVTISRWRVDAVVAAGHGRHG